MTMRMRRYCGPWWACLAEMTGGSYIVGVISLTKHEWRVIGVVVGLLLTGWAAKTYRAAHAGPKPGDTALASGTVQPGKP